MTAEVTAFLIASSPGKGPSGRRHKVLSNLRVCLPCLHSPNDSASIVDARNRPFVKDVPRSGQPACVAGAPRITPASRSWLERAARCERAEELTSSRRAICRRHPQTGGEAPLDLRALTGSQTWKDLGNTPDGGVTARSKLVRRAASAAYDYGRQAYAQAHPDFAQQEAAAAVQRARLYSPVAAPAQVAQQQ